jgi:hypothetical protein
VHIETQLRRGVLDTTLCDTVCQWLTTGRWFSPGTPVSSTNTTDCHDIAEILLKVALNNINHNPNYTSVERSTAIVYTVLRRPFITEVGFFYFLYIHFVVISSSFIFFLNSLIYVYCQTNNKLSEVSDLRQVGGFLVYFHQ